MIKITEKEFKEWIMLQPDERPVDMAHITMDDQYGCAMIEYAKDKNLKDIHSANWSDYIMLNGHKEPIILQKHILDIINPPWAAIHTFKDLKEKIIVDIP